MSTMSSKSDTLQPKPKVIFFHIHKTAGMSLRGLLVRNYRGGAHFNTKIDGELSAQSWNESLERIKAMTPEEMDRHLVFKGHMLFGLHEILPGPVEYITFLRDPVKRAISHYKHLVRLGTFAPGHELDPSKKDWNMPESPYLLRCLDNHQTRLLAGADPALPFGACTEEHLQLAKANMDRHFKFVGLTEQFDLSLILLRHVCGWGWRYYVPDNVARDTSAQLPAKVVEAIRQLNRLDIELYRHAKERFDRLVEHYGAGLKAELALYQLGNRLHQGLHVGRHAVKQRLGIERRKAVGAE